MNLFMFKKIVLLIFLFFNFYHTNAIGSGVFQVGQDYIEQMCCHNQEKNCVFIVNFDCDTWDYSDEENLNFCRQISEKLNLPQVSFDRSVGDVMTSLYYLDDVKESHVILIFKNLTNFRGNESLDFERLIYTLNDCVKYWDTHGKKFQVYYC